MGQCLLRWPEQHHFVTWPEVLQKIERKDFDFTNTLGVIRRLRSGEPALNDTRPIIHDLDMLPAPAWVTRTPALAAEARTNTLKTAAQTMRTCFFPNTNMTLTSDS